MQEIWKDINGYEGLYQVSTLGRVKSLEKNGKKCKILKSNLNNNGYTHVILSKLNKRKTILIHRIVALAFIPNTDNKPQINHINGIKNDNRILNLEWSTAAENTKHAFNTGLRKIPMSSDLQKQRAREIRSKKLIDSVTGVIYPSIRSAYKNYFTSESYLAQMLRGEFPNKTNLQYLNNKLKDGLQTIQLQES